MFMHESCLLVCCPYFNTMKSWTSDPNLHLSPYRHHLCFAFFLVYLFAYFLVCLPSSLLAYLIACHVSCHMLCLLRLYTLYPLRIIYTSLSFYCLFFGFLSLPLHVHTWSEAHGAKAWSPKRKQKGCKCKHVDMSQVVMFSRFRGLASPFWLCTLLNPLPSSLIFLLDGLY